MLPSTTLKPQDYYYELNEPCILADELLSYAQQVEDWAGQDWHTFYLSIPDLESRAGWLRDPVISWFLNQGWTCNFTCMPPKSHYRWHIDNQGNRQTAINLALNGFDTARAIWRADSPWVRKMNSEILDITYKPSTWVLFNTQEQHCVYNFGTENRYIFTLQPGQRFAVPEYHDGLYKDVTSTRYAEILKNYKLAFPQVRSELQAHGW